MRPLIEEGYVYADSSSIDGSSAVYLNGMVFSYSNGWDCYDSSQGFIPVKPGDIITMSRSTSRGGSQAFFVPFKKK